MQFSKVVGLGLSAIALSMTLECRSVDRAQEGSSRMDTATDGGFDGGTRRDAGYADGGQRRPLASVEAPRPVTRMP